MKGLDSRRLAAVMCGLICLVLAVPGFGDLVTPVSINWAKMQPDGTGPIMLDSKIATGMLQLWEGTTNTATWFYIEEADASAGIKVIAPIDMYGVPGYAAPGSAPRIVGTVQTRDGERCIEAMSVEELGCAGSAQLPRAYLVGNRWLGGGQCGDYQLPVKNNPGASPEYSPDPSNVGLRVTIWGKVTAVYNDWGLPPQEKYFYIDDGSACDDGSGDTGVRVTPGVVSGEWVWPEVGHVVEVTGVSCVTMIDGNRVRGLLAMEPVTALPTDHTTSITVYPGWNLLGLSERPLDVQGGLDPWVVFEAFQHDDTNLDLYRYDAGLQSQFLYDWWGPGVFGNCLFGDGYWLMSYLDENDYAVYYSAPDDNDARPRWISLPNEGWSYVCTPFMRGEVSCDAVKFWHECEIKNWLDAYDPTGWVAMAAFWFDAESQSGRDTGPTETWPSESILRPEHGYTIGSSESRVAMIVPWGSDDILLNAEGQTELIHLSWTKSAIQDCTGYNVYRGTSPTYLNKITQTPVSASVFTYDDGAVDPDTQYYYAVTAVHPEEGPYSNIASARLTVPMELSSLAEDETVFSGRPTIAYGGTLTGNTYMGGLFAGYTSLIRGNDSPAGTARTFLKFDLPSPPEGFEVQSAKLCAYCNRMAPSVDTYSMIELAAVCYSDSAGTVDVADDWSEDQITDGQITPMCTKEQYEQYRGSPQGDVHVARKGWYAFNVTNAIGGEYGKGHSQVTFVIEPTYGYGWAYFVDGDCPLAQGRQPYLIIKYQPGSPP